MSRRTEDRPPWSHRDSAVAILLTAVTAAVFSPVAGFEFVSVDDPQYVTDSDLVRNGFDPLAAWGALTEFHADNWHPAVWWSLMLDVQLFGLNPGAIHVVNLGWHLASVAMLFTALRELTGARLRSAAVALLFGVHPLHVESVAWIAERKDVLSGFFWTVGLWAYARWAYTGGIGWKRLVTAALVAGLMSKQIVVTLPCVLLLLDFWPLRRLTDLDNCRLMMARCGGLIAEKGLWFALCGVGCWLAVLAQQTAREARDDWPWTLRLANATVSYVRYLGKAVWPVRLCFPYPYEIPAGSAVIISAAVLLAITVGAIWLVRRNPAIFVGWSWYLGTLVPVIGLVQVGKQPLADRYMYIPLIGLGICGLWSLPVAQSRRATVAYAVASIGIFGALIVRTYQQTWVWRNTDSLYQHAVAIDPSNGDAHFQLGWRAMAQGDVDAGLQHLHTAVTWDRRRWEARRLYGGNHHPTDLSQQFHRWAEIYFALGEAQMRRSGPASALADFREAARLDPDHREARLTLCALLVETGDVAAALAELDDLLRRQPGLLAAQRLRDSLRNSPRRIDAEAP